MGLFIVKTAIGREGQVMDFLASSAKKMPGIHSLIYPHGMTGYIIVEAINPDVIRHIAAGVPYVKGVLRTPTSYEEIEHLIEFKPETIDVNKGDIVSVIAGPFKGEKFKGEKAKIVRVDLQKQQIVLELLEAAVPIPITLGLDSIRVITKAAQVAEQKAEDEARQEELKETFSDEVTD